MRNLIAVPILILASATPLLPADAPPAPEVVREGNAGIGDRLARIERILWERDASTIPLLREWAVKDGSDRVRERAVGALVTLRDDTAPRIYFDRLASDPSPRVRRAAADAIGTLAIPVDRVDRLSTPLRVDADPMVRAECARAVGRAGNRQAFPYLMIALGQDPSPEVRALSAESLMTLNIKESVEILQNAALQDRSSVVRVYAVRALAAIDPNSSSKTFHTVWDQATDADLRTTAYEGMLKTSDAPAWIEIGLQDNDPRVRYLAFHAWQSRVPSGTRGRRLGRNSGEVLRLEAYLKDPLRGIREDARQALERIGYRIVEKGGVYTIAGEQ